MHITPPGDHVAEYTIVAESSAMGRSTVTIRCPFCSWHVVAYVWSLAGSGKRCTNRACRIERDRRGHARSWRKPVDADPSSGGSHS
jgi:hypothetical protein